VERVCGGAGTASDSTIFGVTISSRRDLPFVFGPQMTNA